MVAFQAALSSAAAVIQFAPNSVNPEGSNILDVIANPEKNPAPRLPSFMVDMNEERHARFTSIPGKSESKLWDYQKGDTIVLELKLNNFKKSVTSNFGSL